MQKITPNLWFDNNAEEAVALYTSLFNNSRKGYVSHYGAEGAKVSGMPEGSVLTVEFQLEGYDFIALNGGPVFKFNPSVSFFIMCQTEEEADRMWTGLSQGGSVLMEYQNYPFAKKFGWLNDKFGLSWQVMLAEKPTQKIQPCLMYVGRQAGHCEDAINRYVSIFPDSGIVMLSRYGEGGADKPGTINHGVFSLAGQKFVAMDSALEHKFAFNEAVSFMVDCKDQKEIDYYWERLTEGGEESVCGWLKDKYGVSWQVTPAALTDMMKDPDTVKVERMMKVFLKMKKIDLVALVKAFEGKS
ncbi:VOC family protein [Dehalogenimonas etheniformans]|uniref:VOC family protein n=1 Tax=Dehalogenimonas etheniformans TaxID=1536648 RepID=A0A2P5P4T8_9CHLR|nr:VOC family protein [Dehalogenimonas etheniformans]PPD57312.1 VOC family protein [Dehalogenimonas etheniformans]QNT77030.1 VOC family protein [Dehalogenimonas etheniformans]